MSEINHQRQDLDNGNHPKWFNSPVNIYKGKLSEIRSHIPTFERQDFGLTQPNSEGIRLNSHLDTIVRLPFEEDKTYYPIGVVSKSYALVQHTDILDFTTQAFETVGIAPNEVMAEITMTEYGERMCLSICLPKKWGFDPGDGYPMALRLECLNSMDGSTRFRFIMGWYRFVCRNGLLLGATSSNMKRRHMGDLKAKDIRDVLKHGIQDAETDKKNLERWVRTEISLDRIVSWVNNELKDELGFKAATRTFHIAYSGYDAEIVGLIKDKTPTTVAVQRVAPVPGSPSRCHNLFDLSQILAWLAQERRDIQEQLEWREKIPKLMASIST